MTNKQKYAEEILDIVCAGNDVAFDKRAMKLINCDDLNCDDCLFNDFDSSCSEKLKKWAESEYIEKPVISKKDRAFLDYLKEEYKFITRDKNGMLFVYEAQPRKLEKYWYLSNCSCLGLNRCLNVDFPMIQWSDSEPWLIDDLKKLEVVDEYIKKLNH